MQRQHSREKISSVEQLDTPNVTTKWHRPGGRDDAGGATEINAAPTWRRPGGCDCASYWEPVSNCFMWDKANATAAVYRVIRPAPIPKAFTPKATSKRNERGTYFCESRASWFALPTISAHLTNPRANCFQRKTCLVVVKVVTHCIRSE